MVSGAVALHVSAHPDDEAIAAGMTVSGLATRGWTVVNLLLSAGRPGDEPRRLAEAAEAAKRAGYVLETDADALGQGETGCVTAVLAALDRHRPTLVISPQPHDRHPSHELVGRAVRAALEQSGSTAVWWTWGLWAALQSPTLYVPFGPSALARALDVLDAYRGELERNDYRRLVEGAAASNAVLGSERVFGFGSPAASTEMYAELFTELIRSDGHWYAGQPRVVDLDEPLQGLRRGDPLADD